ncbi:MAG: hypothetical protein Q9165_001438 [Trypethelium subeluteriae]
MENSIYQQISDDEHEEDEIVELEDEDPIIGSHVENGVLQGETHLSTKPTVLYLLFFFLINSLAFGIIAVPRMNLVVSLVCRHALENNGTPDSPPVIIGGFNPQCQSDEISSRTALIAARGNIIVGVLAAAISTSMGRLSDRVGRVKVIAFNTLGLIFTEGTLLTIATFPNSLDYRWLYAAYAIDGASGSYALTMAMASAYVSDSCAPSIRSIQIGRLHGAMFIGIAVGPLLSTLISKIGGSKLPLLVFYVSLSMRFFSILYLQFVPESRLTKTSQLIAEAKPRYLLRLTARSCKPRLSFSKLDPRAWIAHLIPSSVPSSAYLRRNLILLMLIDLLIYAGVMGTMEILILYPQVVFAWGATANNLFMSLVNLCRAAVSTLGLPLLVFLFRRSSFSSSSTSKRSSLSTTSTTIPATLAAVEETHHTQSGADPLDKSLILTSLLIDLLGYLGFALAPSGPLFTLCGALAAFAATGLASTEAALTKHVDGERTGELMGGLGFLQGCVRVVAPSAVNVVYSATVRRGVPGAAFVGIAGVLGVGVGLMGWVRTR